jgi:hypothetical protein
MAKQWEVKPDQFADQILESLPSHFIIHRNVVLVDQKQENGTSTKHVFVRFEILTAANIKIWAS